MCAISQVFDIASMLIDYPCQQVAAMFKIGNSKELPTIPDHLSNEGKDFVRKCLQRNPHDRPSAQQLLEHPFVKCAAPLERPILGAEASDQVTGILHGANLWYLYILSPTHKIHILETIQG